jgi:hypothetical protein
MVYGTTQRHGADIEIESAVGEGTTMRLSFPVPAAATAGEVTTTAPRPERPLRILLVDDDPLVLKSLRYTCGWRDEQRMALRRISDRRHRHRRGACGLRS